MGSIPEVVSTSDAVMKEEELMVVGYCLSLSQIIVNLSKVKPLVAIRYSPSVVSLLSEFLVYKQSDRICQGAYTAMNNVIFYTVSTDLLRKTEA